MGWLVRRGGIAGDNCNDLRLQPEVALTGRLSLARNTRATWQSRAFVEERRCL
jgi:hypothetical protein